MKKITVRVLVITALVLTIGGAVLYATRGNFQTMPKAGCVDNRKQMVDSLGGPQKAANVGVSSTLEGCDE